MASKATLWEIGSRLVHSTVSPGRIRSACSGALRLAHPTTNVKPTIGSETVAGAVPAPGAADPAAGDTAGPARTPRLSATAARRRVTARTPPGAGRQTAACRGHRRPTPRA